MRDLTALLLQACAYASWHEYTETPIELLRHHGIDMSHILVNHFIIILDN